MVPVTSHIRPHSSSVERRHLQLPKVLLSDHFVDTLLAARVASRTRAPRRRDLLRATDPLDIRRDEPAPGPH